MQVCWVVSKVQARYVYSDIHTYMYNTYTYIRFRVCWVVLEVQARSVYSDTHTYMYKYIRTC